MSFGVCSEEEARKMSPKILVMDGDNKVLKKKGRSPLADA
jgi:aspartate 1-decarboxylase